MASFFSRFFGRIHPQGIGVVGGNDGTAPVLVHWLDTTPVEPTDKPCTLESLDVEARVRGTFAEVTQTIKIKNPNMRPLSTQVTFPLPDRATVCGYALDVAGQMVDGVVVPKDEARVVFETEQRRGADPGLVEAVRGNVYNTRVYPVPAHGSRTVRLRYVTQLELGADDATLELAMPAEHLESRAIRISVESIGDAQPVITGLAGTQVERTGISWGARTEERDLTPSEPVRVSLPALPQSFVALERDERGRVWFCATEKASAAVPANTPALARLTVLWDASGSRAGQDHAAEIELARTWASASTVESITLVTFADHVRETVELSSADELAARLASVTYDGGTNLVELSAEVRRLLNERLAKDGTAFALFSDGLDTLGGDPFALPAGCPAVAIVSGLERDLEAARQACGGRAFGLAQAPQSAEELMRALSAGMRGLGGTGAAGVADACYFSGPADERVVLVGRLVGESATIRLCEGGTELALRAEDAREGSLLASAWASRRVSLLAPRAQENADELLRLGREFGVVSPVTSLLVLESLDQWLRYDIEPPRTLTKMHDEWTRRKQGEMRLSSEETQRMLHRKQLESAWAGLMAWHERDFSKTPETQQYGAGGPLGMPGFGAMDSFRGHGGPDLFDAMLAEEALPDSAQPYDDLIMDMEESEPEPTLHEVRRESRRPRERMFAAAAPMMAQASAADRDIAADDAADASPAASVAVKGWMPDAPYLKVLDEAAGNREAARQAYLGQRAAYASSPSFFLDCAGWFFAHDDVAFGATVLSNLTELRIEDAALLRVMAWRLREAGRLEDAVATLRRVLRLRPEDSQSHRDLALVLSELAREAYAQSQERRARTYAQEAGELYRKAALTPWARRPMAIGLFAVEEYNVLRAWAAEQAWDDAPSLPSLGEKLEGVLDCDLRITLAWDADETDVDIHVTEPTGEEAYYAHRDTSIGGRVSEDITDGYGPELYEIHHARDGAYDIRAHYYASHQQAVFGPATCTLTVYTNWGRTNQEQTITTTRLEKAREMVSVGKVAFGDEAAAEDGASEGTDTEEPRQLERGMSRDEAVAALGEPVSSVQDGAQELCQWELPGGRGLLVTFENGAVTRVLERMPWGEEMIVLQ